MENMENNEDEDEDENRQFKTKKLCQESTM
jgi:hypothetical protein